MSVILFGPRSDSQVTAVERKLERRGVRTRIWDVDEWPGNGSITFRQRNGRALVSVDGSPVDHTSIDSIYLRSFALDPRNPNYTEQFENRPLSLLNQLREYRSVLESALTHLEERGVTVVNSLFTRDVHDLKPWQLSALAAEGIPVPETLTTNDPEAVRSFADRLEQVVYKPVGGGGHASLLEMDDLTDERLSLLANAPVQFQERFDGDDIRIFVVGGEVVAAARICSDRLDYRSGEHDVERISLSNLDLEIEAAAIETSDRLGLAFAGVDVINEGDRFCVLEANPSPMFATFDELAGTDVAGALATLLAKEVDT